MKFCLVFILFLSFTCCEKPNIPPVPPEPSDSLPPSSSPKDPLAKGVNLSNWFNDYSDRSQFGNHFTEASLQLIKAKGFTYVRIPIGNTILFNPSNPSTLNANNLTHVDGAVKKCVNAGLAVTINLHPWQNNMDSLLSNDASFVTKLAAYWKAMATYFKKYDSSKIFFEVYNEPHAAAVNLTKQGAAWWRPVQEKLVQAIREVTSDHYIIVGGESWNSISGLTQMQPYSIPKLIYNFHFYDPFLFTHQGASWSGWQPALLAANVPFPSSPEAVAPLITGTSNTELKNTLRWYGDARYNIDSLDAWIKKAYVWAQQNGVRIIVNEFGSYKPNAPVQSRLNWLYATRVTFEKYGIGWAMWEADEGFGWINYGGGNRNIPIADNEVLQALGLQ